MDVALIPPLTLLPYCFMTNTQLALPQLFSNQHYALFYKHLAEQPDQYVILDNGAAEGWDFTTMDLVQVAEWLEPDELVLPDVLGNFEATVSLVTEFFRTLETIPNCKLGLVAAGKDRDDAVQTVHEILNSQYAEHIDVLYIPRSLVTKDTPYERLYVASELLKHYEDLPIHCLGTSSQFIEEPVLLAQSGMIRSVDTSAPFNYAWAKDYIDSGVHVARPAKYFDLQSGFFQDEFVLHNINKLLTWATGVR